MALFTECELVTELRQGANRLVTMSTEKRTRLIEACIQGIQLAWQDWVQESWVAKRIPVGHGARAEDILTGPIPTLRYLRLIHKTLDEIERYGQPKLPGEPFVRNGRLQVPVFPTRSLFDRLLFSPFQARVTMSEGIQARNLYGQNLDRATGKLQEPGKVSLVLGAGNVSSIPATDALTKIFQDNHAVLLKMNPVNAYLKPVFERAFKALIDADLLRIVEGGAEVGAKLVAHNEIDQIHITGSDKTHDAIVWGSDADERHERKAKNDPLLDKPITSELGNVTPWIIVPGKYSHRQLRFQAENIAASITNNASFNCIATKMLVVQKDWPQRTLFLDLIDQALSRVPNRFAYYPGAADRFEEFSGLPADPTNHLPWTILRDVNPVDSAKLFMEESFVCVAAETGLLENSPANFLRSAVEFANKQLWGTLAAAITVPRSFQKQHNDLIEAAIASLRYGTVGINQWPGIVFALMSTPWGAFPGSTLQNIQSGIGSVHNTFLLDQPEKSVVSSALTVFPKPAWFSSHRCPESVARSLMKLYLRPSMLQLPAVLWHAMRG